MVQMVVKPYTIKDRGLGEIIIGQTSMNRVLPEMANMGIEFTTYQYRKASLDTIAWFMYGVKPCVI